MSSGVSTIGKAIAAERGAELGISRGRASTQMHYGSALIKRFPKLDAVFLAGRAISG